MMILVALLGIGLLMLACHLSYWKGRKDGYWKGLDKAWTLARRIMSRLDLTPQQKEEISSAMLVERAILAIDALPDEERDEIEQDPDVDCMIGRYHNGMPLEPYRKTAEKVLISLGSH